MRRADLPEIVAALRAPTQQFVREARARMVLLVRGSGQVLAQHGFTQSYEVMNVASLAAAAHASARALAELVGSRSWTHLYHAGRERSLFLASLSTPIEELIVVVIFDGESSLGVVQLFYDRMASEIAALPVFQVQRAATDQANFERDLEAGLTRVLHSEAASED
jgi:predicted regulator of Ras-like GTPase activity (Roadblock/LC7/MglB family)